MNTDAQEEINLLRDDIDDLQQGMKDLRTELLGLIEGRFATERVTATQLLLQAQTGDLIEELARVFMATSLQLSAAAAQFKLGLR